MGIIRKIVIAFLLGCMASGLKAQDETLKTNWATPLHIEGCLTASSPCKHVLPFGAYFDLNYGIKRFSIHALFEGSYFLPKEGFTKKYNKTTILGAGLGFELFPRKEYKKGVVEARAVVSRSLGSTDFRHTAYKIGLQWHVTSKKRDFSPAIGFGYCLRSFSNKNLNTYNGVYLALGIRF